MLFLRYQGQIRYIQGEQKFTTHKLNGELHNILLALLSRLHNYKSETNYG